LTLADLIAYFEKGADSCEAYARSDPPMKKRDAEHYEKRAKWHREAAKLLLDLSQSD
jgi:hypothetical protein